jgi:hypothetical protein
MVAQLYLWALRSLSVASYYSQGYGGGILNRLHTDKKSNELVALDLLVGPHQSFWLQIQRFEFDFRRYQIF